MDIKSIYVKFGYKNDEVTPKVNEVHWSEPSPVEVSADPENKREWINFKRINFVLNEGFVQFGSNIYKQSSGIFMVTSPAPD